MTFVLVGLTGALLGWARSGPFPVMPVIAVAGAVAFLSAGAECWTNILDRNIDGLMPRTAGRPLPCGRIPLHSAAVLGAVLTATGLLLAASLGAVPFLFLAFALINNVVVYSLLTKRYTPWSIVLGAAVGPLTLWAGYAAVHEPISEAAWLLGAMVAVWVPVHIWAIALRFHADYANGHIPMAPVVWPRSQLAVTSFLSTVAMGGLAVASLLLLGGPAARWLTVPIGTLSLLIAAGAVLLPWHEQLAALFIRGVTVYLVLVLAAAVGCAV
ncbi:MAG: UbiA family prenyltransferase [Candidatus Dormibacteria bacterium]